MNPPQNSAATSRPASRTIFAVDDDETDRLHLLRTIGEAQLPHHCRLFSCGEEMLDALLDVLRGAPPPVACFVDVKMTGMSGLDVLRWIRAQRGLQGIPVVMMSSSDAPAYLNEAGHFGAQCYAAKFPSPEQLREILAAAEHYSAAANASVTFPLRCNLLPAHEHVS